MLRLSLAAAVLITASWARSADAQITAPRILSAQNDRFATLDEQLTNRLRATADDQKAYIDFVVKQVRKKRLDLRLVVAVERYALRRNRHFPFPYFERALRYEAAKRGVALPTVRQFASTKLTGPAGAN